MKQTGIISKPFQAYSGASFYNRHSGLVSKSLDSQSSFILRPNRSYSLKAGHQPHMDDPLPLLSSDQRNNPTDSPLLPQRAETSKILLKPDEFSILQYVLFNREKKDLFSESMSSIKRTRERQKSSNTAISKSLRQLDFSRLFSPSQANTESDSVDIPKVKIFVSSPTRLVDESEIKNFIHIQASNLNDPRSTVILLSEMIIHANQFTLPALSLYLDRISTDPAISVNDYETLSLSLLSRALEALPKTKYVAETGEVEELLGSENLDTFGTLVSKFTKEGENTAKAWNSYFQLLARSGSFPKAEEFLEEFLNSKTLLAEHSIDEFFSALDRYLSACRRVSHLSRLEYNDSIKTILFKYRNILLSQNITPSIAQFLFEFSAYLDEFYGVLNLIEDSKHCEEIFSKCQPKIIQTAVRCSIPHSHWADLESESSCIISTPEKDVLNISPDSPIIRKNLIYTKAMATMFGILDRFTNTSAGLTKEALDQCLILSARLGNSGGMYKALSLRLEQDKPGHPISKETLSQIFDAFPINQGPMSLEKRKSSSLWIINDAIIADSARDDAILFHLRSHINPFDDSKVYIQYLSALGRCLRVDLLSHEWDTIISPLMNSSNGIEHAYFPDFVISLLAAFKTANSTNNALSVLDALLLESTRSNTTHGYSISILEKVLTHEVLPLLPTLNHLSRWLISNKAATHWSDSDVTQLFDDVSSTNMIPSDVSLLITESSPSENSVIVGKLLSELVLQVRRGKDVDIALKHLEQMFGHT